MYFRCIFVCMNTLFCTYSIFSVLVSLFTLFFLLHSLSLSLFELYIYILYIIDVCMHMYVHVCMYVWDVMYFNICTA